MISLFPPRTADSGDEVKPPVAFRIGNDRRSPYRFKITNLGCKEDSVGAELEVFAGRRMLQRLAWRNAPPTVYEARARRQGRSKDVLITASYCGTGSNYHCFTGVWLFSERTKRLKLLRDGLHYGESSRLAGGIVREADASRWLFYPPRRHLPDGWYHRTWTYDGKAQRLIPRHWHRGQLPRHE